MDQMTAIEVYQKTLSEPQRLMFDALRDLLHQIFPHICETIFVKQPYFYLKEYENIKFHHRPSIMMSFFGDHVNIFATSNVQYKDQLKEYHFTDKNTMQIRLNQSLNESVLKALFNDSLSKA